LNNKCIFCNIIHKIVPANIIYDDEHIIAFNDINPKADVHFLIIPKIHLESLLHANNTHQQLLAHIINKINVLAQLQGLANGYRVIINNGINGQQEVPHLHVHIYGNK
jgi:histidine triad (HIT) family protein